MPGGSILVDHPRLRGLVQLLLCEADERLSVVATLFSGVHRVFHAGPDLGADRLIMQTTSLVLAVSFDLTADVGHDPSLFLQTTA